MKRILVLALMIIGAYTNGFAQELYVFTEPASNMPTKSIGVRITNEGMFNNPDFVSRTIPEVMIGFNKNLMMHAQGFLSDMDGKYRLEGGSLYAKYRFLSLDEAHSHFRAAAFGRISSSNRPNFTRDINLEGDNSGWQTGLIFTQLLHKLALSATLGYADAIITDKVLRLNTPQPDKMLSYSLSSGYLVLPVVYKDYKQPNFNVYLELLGKTDPSSGQSYLDIAPAIQVILNSTTRIDLGYRFQATGNMDNRYTKNMYLLRAEFNFFNVLK
ncbi:hypothetical protein SRABI27_01889 [Pedobacter sp. Bi27]|uniref:hypothetical protein n=1 Tax=Pedobacter sp. Bi27 TaxID=2822351 RepID=UPI001D81B163|nr:hypothetical protein [Pedobacter sp. Bi27]CAH0207003.1 hypothetical protein SRABI27_01889 [Pedobacter sp. Bi27]